MSGQEVVVVAGVVFNANGAKPPLPLEEYDPPPPLDEMVVGMIGESVGADTAPVPLSPVGGRVRLVVFDTAPVPLSPVVIDVALAKNG